MEFIELEPSFDPSLLEPPSTPGHWFGGSLSEEEDETSSTSAVPRGPIVVHGGGFKSNRPVLPVASIGTPVNAIGGTVSSPIPSAVPSSSIQKRPRLAELAATNAPLTKAQKKRLSFKRNLRQKRLEAESVGAVSLSVEHHVLREAKKAEKRAVSAFRSGLKEATIAKQQEEVIPTNFFSSSEAHQEFKDFLPYRNLSRDSLARADSIAVRALQLNNILSTFAPPPKPIVNNPRDYLHQVVFRKEK